MYKAAILSAVKDDKIVAQVVRIFDSLEFELSRFDLSQVSIIEKKERADVVVFVSEESAFFRKAKRMLENNNLFESSPTLLVTSAKILSTIDFCKLADDFLLLPVNSDELEARIKLMLWKTNGVDPSQVVSAGKVKLNLSTYEVTVNDELIDLTFKEYELLRYLMTHRGRVYTRRDLLNRVWGEDYYGGPRTVDVHIRRIRSKVENIAEEHIQTVHGVGYKFVV